MTRDEAIKIIDCYDLGFYDLSGAKIPADKLADAFDMAIESLSADEEKENGTFVNRDNCNFNCNDSNRTLVEVVRCKNCIHYESDGGALMVCSDTGVVVDDDDFCSYGERREQCD